jgi:general secretion pathway protein K
MNRHSQKMSAGNHQRGVALITALLIMAIATTAAVYLTVQNQLSIRRTANIITGNQAQLYALGGEALVMSVLNTDIKQNQIDCLSDIWAIEAPPLPVDGGFVQGKITDLQGRFNVNNLIGVATATPNPNPDPSQDPNNPGSASGGGTESGAQQPPGVNPAQRINTVSRERFIRLLQQFDIPPEVAGGLTDALTDWLDADIDTTGTEGAEDSYYVGLEPPYRAANGPMTSLSELRMVRGFDKIERFDELLTHLTALPVRTPINVNTASREVLASLQISPLLAEQIAIMTGAYTEPDSSPTAESQSSTTQPQGGNLAAALAAATNLECFQTLDDFKRAAQAGPEFQNEDITIASNYFLYTGSAQVDRGQALLKSLLHRDNTGMMQVVMRSQGDL